jgi:MraZ protein
MRLMGNYEHTLDDKSRLAIPAKFRDKLGDTVILTNGNGTCILGYPLAEWELIEEGLANLSAAQADEVAFLRFIYPRAVDCEIDKQGRILIPIPLREYAQIKDNVVILGMGKRFEIWSKENWQAEQAKLDENNTMIVQSLGDRGLKL